MNEINTLDASAIKTLKDLMKDRFNFLIETFFSNTEKQLQNLQIAIDDNNTEEITSLTHALKGSCGSVGASGMHNMCRIYEERSRNSDLGDVKNWAKLLTVEFERYKTEIHTYL